VEEKIKKSLLSLGIVKDLGEKVAGLEKELAAASSVAFGKKQRQCWVDDSNCPYGNPEGKFESRPRGFCTRGGCQKITDAEEEFGELLFGEIGHPVSLEDWLRENKPSTLADELSAVLKNNDGELDEDEKILIKAVVEMLKGGIDDYNPEVFLAEDLA